jgi:hypothetical protein
MLKTLKGEVSKVLAGLTVSGKLVVVERLPGSVAVTITVEIPDTNGVPLMMVPVKLRPDGSPLADKVNPVGVCASVKVPARLKLKVCPTVAV